MSEPRPDVRVVLCTCPAEHADRIARTLLEEHLVACITVVSGVKSLYWWKGKVEDEAETLLVIKAPSAQYQKLEQRLREIHPYEVPEVLSLEVVDGLRSYLSWVTEAASC